ncbi:MAG: DNA topoisomerase IB [Burkholderiaceae bacterium]
MDRSPSRTEPETTLASVAEAIELSAAVGLVYVSDADPGFRRVRKGQRFAYLGTDERTLRDAKVLARIASLAIPPAYEKVWVCANDRGHLQATGHDARGRKQYRYHPEWRTARDGAKFERMIEFGEALPRMRRRLKRDLQLPGLPRDKVLAAVVSLLDATRIRIGNAEYARDNASFGLTTLKDRHVTFVRDGRARFTFKGKGGLEHDVTVDDRRLSRIVRNCQHIPGQQLFQYLDDDGARHPITSDLVNVYLQDAMGEDFTAKDFRTWSATLSAIALMAATPLPEAPSERALKAAIVTAIKAVAAELRNTPTVARKSYINPVVFTAWRSGALHTAIEGRLEGAPRKAEKFALAFLRGEAKAAAKAGRKTKQ